MTRHRWLHARWPTSMWDLSEQLKQSGFSDERSDGFLVDKVRKDFLEARYIERIEYTESILDPFGREMVFDRVEFNECAFRASVRLSCLELVNPPRRVQKLFNRLSSLSKFSLAIRQTSLNVMEWSAIFAKNAKVNALVDLLQVTNLEIGDGVTAKAVIKGNTDVLGVINEWTEGRKYVVEKVQLRLTGSFEGTVLLTNVGTAKVDSSNSNELLESLRLAWLDLTASNESRETQLSSYVD